MPNEKYKTVQINISWEKHEDMIKWLVQKAKEDETSLNSIIIRALKKEYQRDVENGNKSV
jgi:predicted HicB family RNase H-like nuclease